MSLDIGKLMEELRDAINDANADIQKLKAVRPAGDKKQEEEVLVLSAAIAKVVIQHIQENADVFIDSHDNALAQDPGGTAPNQHPVRISRQKGYIR